MVALDLYRTTNQPYVEHCCHVWAGASNCYLDMLGKPQKQVFKTVGPKLVASIEPLPHRQNVAMLISIWSYFGRCLSELAELVPIQHAH